MTQEMVWQVVSDDSQQAPENKISFDQLDDSFTGKYLGMRTITPAEGSPYQQARWEANNEIFFTNANHSLRNGLKSVRVGSLTRVTFTAEQDTGQESLMKLFRVEVAKPARTTRTAGSENT